MGLVSPMARAAPEGTSAPVAPADRTGGPHVSSVPSMSASLAPDDSSLLPSLATPAYTAHASPPHTSLAISSPPPPPSTRCPASARRPEPAHDPPRAPRPASCHDPPRACRPASGQGAASARRPGSGPRAASARPAVPDGSAPTPTSAPAPGRPANPGDPAFPVSTARTTARVAARTARAASASEAPVVTRSSTRTTGPPHNSRAPPGATVRAPARLFHRCRASSPDWSATARRCLSTAATRAGTPARRNSPAAASAIRRTGS
ncbi:hypothetical protein QFZ66_005297 [Streptomyces sp. B4I13]|nr:hypothetical protein [Streptomyces sp. B4I13]